MRSAARELGTARVRTSSVKLIARTPWNHNPHVLGASWDRSAVAPCSQISVAVTPRSNPTGASTGVENSSSGHRKQPADRQVRPLKFGEVRLRGRGVGE